MEKWMKIIISLILIALIVSGFLIYNNYKKKIQEENDRIHAGNFFVYRYLNCSLNCPIYFNETINRTRINKECYNNCKLEYQTNSYYYKGNLFNDEMVRDCLEKSKLDKDVSRELNLCLKEILPKLREKYNIEYV